MIIVKKRPIQYTVKVFPHNIPLVSAICWLNPHKLCQNPESKNVFFEIPHETPMISGYGLLTIINMGWMNQLPKLRLCTP